MFLRSLLLFLLWWFSWLLYHWFAATVVTLDIYFTNILKLSLLPFYQGNECSLFSMVTPTSHTFIFCAVLCVTRPVRVQHYRPQTRHQLMWAEEYGDCTHAPPYYSLLGTHCEQNCAAIYPKVWRLHGTTYYTAISQWTCNFVFVTT